MTPAEVVTAMGRATRAAARSDEPSSDFSKGQLMSAFSASRHLTVELAEFGPALRTFAGEVSAAVGDGGLGAALEEHVRELREAATGQEIGDVVAAMLDRLRDDPSPDAARVRARIHGLLRSITDREVALLAEVIEGERR